MLPSTLQQFNPLIIEDLIRLGANADGGYVVPRSVVMTADVALSFGIGMNWSFELDLAKLRPDIHVHAYDNSVGDSKFLEYFLSAWNNFMQSQGSLSEIRAIVELYESFRSFFQGKVTHFQERIFDRVVHPADITVDKVFARLNGRERILLKMDIDGGEYRIMEELLRQQSRIPLMVIEFHATEFLRDLFLDKVAQVLQHYDVVHIHGNNYVGTAPDRLPGVLEITFLHKTLCPVAAARRNRLPLPGLDFPNNPMKADHEFVFADK
jgi:hypothetical protein